ncbi:dynamin family protein [Epibacterium ulvae]|uniref:dynamin family protein n=1 Tax=Epibacterium ulvae TaxID=1156985 RepID=UPI0024910D40|nr:dynamin family protein [Epibacterium ulvae]
MNAKTQFEVAQEVAPASEVALLDTGFTAFAAFRNEKDEVRRALQRLAGVCSPKIARGLERQWRALDGFEPAMTILGQVKSGKTSLINAMAGRPDLLPCDVNPWTSVVTSLHLRPGRDQSVASARFQFMSEEEWDRLLQKGGRIGEMAGRIGAEGELQKIRAQIDDMRARSRRRLGDKFETLMGQVHEYGYVEPDLIERYICLGDTYEDQDGSDQGRFADITRAADLTLNAQALLQGLCLRDTPGVNDTFMMREQVTLRAVRDSGLCVVVLSAGQALSSVDLGLIRILANLDRREVIIFVNRIDELSDPAQQIPEIEASIRETLRVHQGPEDAEILFGSAYWANAALRGEVETLSPASAAALLNWAEVRLERQQELGVTQEDSTEALLWSLSAVPALNHLLSKRCVEREGKPLLERAAAAAVAAASGVEASFGIQIQSSQDVDAREVAQGRLFEDFTQLKSHHLREFERELTEIETSFQNRADRAHAGFLDRATQALLLHLDNHGDQTQWEYDPSGLRMLLRSAYSVMNRALQNTGKSRYEAAVEDVARLLHARFGTKIEGIMLGVPTCPDVPAPVGLGQTLALDFYDGWWAGWWRRTRGYSAFADKFRALIAGETEDFMQQVKFNQLEGIKQDFLTRLQGFLDEMEAILVELSDAQERDFETHLSDGETAARRAAVADALQVLRNYVA